MKLNGREPVIQRSRRTRLLFCLPLALLLVASACGDDDDDTSTGDTTGASTATTAGSATTEASGSATTGAGGGTGAPFDEAALADLSGEITISGSSTVEPISTVVLGKFEDLAPDVSVSIEGPGTTAGFEKFCKGEADISDASRPIREAEIEACKTGGVEFVELKIGLDGLSVITSPNNDAVDCLSKLDLWALLGKPSEGLGTWADAKAKADEAAAKITDQGANNSAKYPAEDLVVTAPGPESGTYGSFIELALDPVSGDLVDAGVITEDQEGVREDYTTSGNDNTIIDGISGSDYSLGWVGFAFADQNSDKVKTLEIDGGDGCVAPDAATVADNSYPLSRALYIYVNAAKASSNPALAGFVDYYLSDGGITSVEEADYIPLDASVLDETRALWTAKTPGTQES
jgi:phosphate transport system substrate-binding protein